MNVLLFLGAGASVQFGMPTTKEFKNKLFATPELKDQGTVEKILKIQEFKDHEIMKELLNVPDYKDIEHVLRGIKDIEDIGKCGKKFLNFLKTSDKQHLRLDFDRMLKELDLCKKIINKYVYEFYSFDKNEIEKIKTHYDSLLESIFDGKINIVTTNYDQIIEEYVRHTKGKTPCDGFKHDESINKNVFRQDNFDENQNDVDTINIYKLHGSLNWKKINDDIIRQDIEEQNREESENILIYPTLDPKDGLDGEPFASINDKFEEHMDITDVCVVVGYSFRDCHINDIFKQFVMSGKKLIIVSPTVESDLQNVDFISDENSAHINISAISVSEYIGLKTDYEKINRLRVRKKILDVQIIDAENHSHLDRTNYENIKKERIALINELQIYENNYRVKSRSYGTSLNFDDSKNIHKIQMNVESLTTTFILKFILKSISRHERMLEKASTRISDRF